METVFTVGVIEKIDIAKSIKRCVGYFKSFEEAEDVVKNNITDIYSCLYEYAVIEEFSDGLYPKAKSIHFYKYDEETNKYAEIYVPKEWENICNFTMG